MAYNAGPAMALAPGSRIGPYEIAAQIGVGGMGEVYRATDTNLKRSVAIKVLPDALTSNGERLHRFQREAEVLASLNHPNIAQVYGLEDAADSKALVMELVAGPTLADRIAHGAIPRDEALGVARQICEALEAAHEQGIIHRDLKPANIKVRADGVVKVLDFGLAKAVEPTRADTAVSPTITSPAMLTGLGVILGTAAYMSPEQAKGKAVDKRTDIWAFGCVLYEMLTARRAFNGEGVSDTLARVIEREPDWTVLPPGTPNELRRLLARCLEKDPRRRLRDIGDAEIEIGDFHAQPLAAASSRAQLQGYWGWIAALVVATVAISSMTFGFRQLPPMQEMRVEISTPVTTDPISLALSPDARTLVFVATSDNQPRLWLRPLDVGTAHALSGTDGASFPFWSPDSRSVAFFAESKLKTVDIESNEIRVLADVQNARGGAWSRDGVILFGQTVPNPIYRLDTRTNKPVAVTRVLPPKLTAHRFPQFLPDGRHFLFWAGGLPESRGAYVSDLEASEPVFLLATDTAAVFCPPNQLLFTRGGTLFAQTFDPDRRQLSGDPVQVAEGVASDEALYLAAISASAVGPFAYRAGDATQRQLTWFDRTGRQLGRVAANDAVSGRNPELSPDGQRIALDRSLNGTTDIWVIESERDVITRVTSSMGPTNTNPAWFPDNRSIVFASDAKGKFDLFRTSLNNPGEPEQLLDAPASTFPLDVSPDGRFLLFRTNDPKTGTDIAAIPLLGDRQPFRVVQTPFDDREGQFSPDGKWIAYQSNEPGRFEIYVRPFPGPGDKLQVSVTGGVQPRWRRDGKELFYLSLSRRMMVASIRFGLGQRVEVSSPLELFATQVIPTPTTGKHQYAVSANGERFLINTTVEQSTAPITLLLNWKPPSTR